MDVDVFSNDFCQKRYFYYSNLRSKGAIEYSTFSKCWLVIGYNESNQILSDHRTFLTTPIFHEIDPILFGSKIIEHTYNRQVMNKGIPAFKINLNDNDSNGASIYDSASKRLSERISSMVELDLLYDFIVPFTVYVALTTMGLENIGNGKYDLSNKDEDTENIVANLVNLYQDMDSMEYWIQNILNQDLKDHPVFNSIYSKINENHSYTHDDFGRFFKMLFISGFESSVGLLSNSAHLLLTNKEILKNVSKNFEETFTQFINEALRFFSPAQMTFRVCDKETIIENKTLKEGDIVTVLIGAANRDSSIFENPDDFNLERKNTSHIAFGKGIHYCLGHHLSKVVAKAVLKELVPQLSNMALISDEISYDYSPVINKISSLKIIRN